MKAAMAQAYAHPELLVSTSWVTENLSNSKVRIVESNEDTLLYASGHLEGAVHVDWVKDLNDPIRRDYINRANFEALCSHIGLTPEITLVFYGDKNNWWACYALWVFQLFGFSNVKIMDGGRLKWEKEKRPFTQKIRPLESTNFRAAERNDRTNRAFRDEVLAHIAKGLPLVDVRTWEEYSGERLHMPDYPNEGALRGGHIPGALHIPWSRAVNPETGSFRTAQDLRQIYVDEKGLNPKEKTLVYCRIGERSSHTWFVLKYLLGFQDVKNYDGSWTEWGNLVNVPVIKGPESARNNSSAGKA